MVAVARMILVGSACLASVTSLAVLLSAADPSTSCGCGTVSVGDA